MRHFKLTALAVIYISLLTLLPFTNASDDGLNFEITLEKYTLNFSNISPSSISQNDLNNDTIPELIITDENQNITTTFEGRAEGTFASPRVIKSIKATYSATADLNNDDASDLILLSKNENSLEIILNDKQGNFKNSYKFMTSSDPNDLVIADFDKDGKKDILVVNKANKSLTLFKGIEESVLIKSKEIILQDKPYFITHADFNKDKNLDIAVSFKESNKVQLLTGNGKGNFTHYKTIKIESNPAWLEAKDLNEDENVDLVVANEDSNNVAVIIGNNFLNPIYYPVAGKPNGLILADLNSDHSFDIVTSNDNKNNISVLRGNKDGTFNPSIEFSLNGNVVALSKIDINKDKKDDLVLATNSEITLLIQKQEVIKTSEVNNEYQQEEKTESIPLKDETLFNESTADSLSKEGEIDYATNSILVKFKENIDPNSVTPQIVLGIQELAATEIKIERLHTLAPAITKEKLRLKKYENKKGITINNRIYSSVDKIPKDELFKSAYKSMPKDEKDSYRSYVVKLPKSLSVQDAISAFKENSNVEIVEPNWIFKIQVLPDDKLKDEDMFLKPTINISSTSVNDPLFSYQYGLHTTNSDKAWETSTGENVIVAVIDTGVDYSHEDIAQNIWENPNEIPNNKIDDDGNGFIDDVHGYDFVNYDNDPTDDRGHGTHVSGIIAAVKDNNLGIAGVAPKAKILPVKGLNKEGKGSVGQLAQAIYYAADIGANITNNSWSGRGQSKTLENAFNYSKSKGTINIAAAGNDSQTINHYQPGGINSVIAVAATDQNDKKAYYSNWGTDVAVTAPGASILSLRANNTKMGKPFLNKNSKYTIASGTSFACPHVSGLAALILSKNKAYDFLTLKGNIQATTKKPEPGQNLGKFRYIGTGIIQSDRAVKLENFPVIASKIDSQKILRGEFIANNKEALEIYGEVKGNSYSISYSKEYPYSNNWIEVFKSGDGNIDKKGLLATIYPTSFEHNELIFLKLAVQKNGFETYTINNVRFVKYHKSKTPELQVVLPVTALLHQVISR